MPSLRPGGAPRLRTSRAPNRLLPLLVVTAVLATSLAGPALADHGGRDIGSLLACDRPVEPPRCTSVGDDFLHYVAFDASLSEGLAASLRDTMREDYAPTRLHMIVQPEVTPETDVIAFSGDFGDNGAAGWVYCPPDAEQGRNTRGDRWCRHQELFFNLNARYRIFFDDDASRDHVACHELGHTIGLRHWGNPPESEGPAAATCMNSNTPNGPTTLHAIDVDHINDYPYAVWPTPPDVTIAGGPAPGSLGGGRGIGSIEATGVERPTSVEALVDGSDAVVLGSVVSVEPGRAFGPPTRQLHYASAVVEVVELVTGQLPAEHRERLVVEVPLFDGLESIARVRDGLVGTDRILFLSNKGASARAAGLGADAVATDAQYYRLAGFDAELVVDDGVARRHAAEDSVLDRFDGASLARVLDRLRAAAP
jgi:hypothetical protein